MLWDKYTVHYGLPEKILTDQGQDFPGRLIQELCKISGIKKLRTSPYHPKTNGQCKRFNSMLINMIGTLPAEAKENWQSQLPTLVHAYNCTKNNATGFSPYELLYGRKATLPIDVQYGIRRPNIESETTYHFTERLRERLKWSFNKAKETALKEMRRHKKRKDLKIRSTKLQAGDLVLV